MRSASTMSASEPLKRHGDDPGGLRARYNQLCVALTSIAGTNGAAADRLLQELQALAQKIAIRQAEVAAAGQPAPGAVPLPQPTPKAPMSGNVVAFRCKVKGIEQENPRLSTVLSALADRAPPPSAAAPAAPVVALAAHSDEIDRLQHSSDEHAHAIERFERQLGTSGPLSTLSVQVAAMRAENALQGQQLVSLATAVHRLAKLIAAQPEPGSRP